METTHGAQQCSGSARFAILCFFFPLLFSHYIQRRYYISHRPRYDGACVFTSSLHPFFSSSSFYLFSFILLTCGRVALVAPPPAVAAATAAAAARSGRRRNRRKGEEDEIDERLEGKGDEQLTQFRLLAPPLSKKKATSNLLISIYFFASRFDWRTRIPDLDTLNSALSCQKVETKNKPDITLVFLGKEKLKTCRKTTATSHQRKPI